MSDEGGVHHRSALANKLDPRVHDSGDSETAQKDEAAAASSDMQALQQQGEDPSIVKSDSKKMTGTAAPGSHSALFGLTPDGEKTKDVDYSGGPTVKAAHSKETTISGKSDGDGSDDKSAGNTTTKESVSGSTSGPSSGGDPSNDKSTSTSDPSSGSIDGGATSASTSGPSPGDSSSGDKTETKHAHKTAPGIGDETGSSSGTKPGDALQGDDHGHKTGSDDAMPTDSQATPQTSGDVTGGDSGLEGHTSRPGGPELAKQMDDPHVTQNQKVGTSDTGKPGSGSSSAPPAGSDADTAPSSGIMDTVKNALGFGSKDETA